MTFNDEHIVEMYLCLGLLFSAGACLDNLALHKPAWMSTLYTGYHVGYASNAVDGNHNPIYVHGSCSHTKVGDASPWLIVDLLEQYYVHNITIVNRQDSCCFDWLSDFLIEVFETNPSRCASANGSLCLHYPGVFGAEGNVLCDEPVLGRFVRIWKLHPNVTDYSGTLIICELEVYGQKLQACEPSYYSATPNKRLISSANKTYSASSGASCVTECEKSGACVAVNYNVVSGVCEHLSRPESNDSVVTDFEWAYYGNDLC